MSEARESGESATVSREMLEAAYDAIESRQPEPHICLVHPRGGVCFGCGQPWRLVDGHMERVLPDSREARHA